MKKIVWSISVCLLLLLCIYKTEAQDSGSNLDQFKLMQAWLGTWQQKLDKDTIEVWKIKQFGYSFTMDVSRETKGKKVHLRKNDYTFSHDDGKFVGFQIYFDGSYDTWIGSFTSDKKFSLEITKNFAPGSTEFKYEMEIQSPASFKLTRFEKGVKVKEFIFTKGK